MIIRGDGGKVAFNSASDYRAAQSAEWNEMPDDFDHETYRARLSELRRDLLALDESSRESRQTVELDQSRVGRLSRMDALQGQAMAQATERRRGLQIRKIDAALARLEEGEFGYCVNCGEEIPQKRLALDPALPNCVACAAG